MKAPRRFLDGYILDQKIKTTYLRLDNHHFIVLYNIKKEISTYFVAKYVENSNKKLDSYKTITPQSENFENSNMNYRA